MNRYTIFETPLGTMTIQANELGLIGAWFETQVTQPEQLGERIDNDAFLLKVQGQLLEYFSGKRQYFELQTAATGTEFQTQVWRALTTIPYGETWSYQQLAEAIGNPKAVRAVGLANGKNPLSVIVPCHRVIGKNGKLTGYAGGVGLKEALLKLEQQEH